MTRTCSSCGAEYPATDQTVECAKAQGALPCGGLILPLGTKFQTEHWARMAGQPICLLCMDSGSVRLFDNSEIKCPRGHTQETA